MTELGRGPCSSQLTFDSTHILEPPPWPESRQPGRCAACHFLTVVCLSFGSLIVAALSISPLAPTLYQLIRALNFRAR